MSRSGTVRGAIAAMRAGMPVRIEGSIPLTVTAVETATAELLDLLDATREAPLLISGERAAALSLANLRDAADPSRPVLIKRASWLNRETARDLVDPGGALG